VLREIRHALFRQFPEEAFAIKLTRPTLGFAATPLPPLPKVVTSGILIEIMPPQQEHLKRYKLPFHDI
jgi:hypothetical protein